MNRMIILLVVGLLSIGATTSIAGPGYGHGGNCSSCDMAARFSCDHHPGGEIELRDDQREQIRALREAEKEKLAPLREEMRKLREEMKQAMENDPIDENRARQLARAKADKKIDLKLLKREFRTKVEALLSPEQVAQFKERHESRQENRGKYGGKRGHHGPGSCGNCYNKSE